MHTILLVEDNETLRKALRKTLVISGGFAVVEAENGRQARQLLETHPIDLVVTDVIMPEEEGVETILRMRKQRAKLPIIAMSGGARLTAENCLELAQAAGADLALGKPFTAEQMLAGIRQLLGAAGPVSPG
jgi:DNA-binding response OmpR family regulator